MNRSDKCKEHLVKKRNQTDMKKKDHPLIQGNGWPSEWA